MYFSICYLKLLPQGERVTRTTVSAKPDAIALPSKGRIRKADRVEKDV